MSSVFGCYIQYLIQPITVPQPKHSCGSSEEEQKKQ